MNNMYTYMYTYISEYIVFIYKVFVWRLILVSQNNTNTNNRIK